MDILALCPFSVGVLLWEAKPSQWSLTVCVKATFSLVDGGEATVAEMQDPIFGDRPWDNDPRASLFGPDDVAPLKPKVDVLLSGHAHAPPGGPVTELVASMRVGDFYKALRVTGDRIWVRSAAGLAPSDPAPFSAMPLRYERAARTAENPVGIDVSAATPGTPAAPNIEAEDGGAPGFGAIAPSWPARRGLLSEAALAWVEGVTASRDASPGPAPAGVDFRYFNAAPADQQLDMLRVGTSITLENLHPELPVIESRLPAIRPQVFRVDPASGRVTEVALRSDTIWIHSDRGVAVVCYRGLTDVRGGSYEAVGKLVVTSDPKGKRISCERVDKALRENALHEISAEGEDRSRLLEMRHDAVLPRSSADPTLKRSKEKPAEGAPAGSAPVPKPAPSAPAATGSQPAAAKLSQPPPPMEPQPPAAKLSQPPPPMEPQPPAVKLSQPPPAMGSQSTAARPSQPPPAMASQPPPAMGPQGIAKPGASRPPPAMGSQPAAKLGVPGAPGPSPAPASTGSKTTVPMPSVGAKAGSPAPTGSKTTVPMPSAGAKPGAPAPTGSKTTAPMPAVGAKSGLKVTVPMPAAGAKPEAPSPLTSEATVPMRAVTDKTATPAPSALKRTAPMPSASGTPSPSALGAPPSILGTPSVPTRSDAKTTARMPAVTSEAAAPSASKENKLPGESTHKITAGQSTQKNPLPFRPAQGTETPFQAPGPTPPPAAIATPIIRASLPLDRPIGDETIQASPNAPSGPATPFETASQIRMRAMAEGSPAPEAVPMVPPAPVPAMEVRPPAVIPVVPPAPVPAMEAPPPAVVPIVPPAPVPAMEIRPPAQVAPPALVPPMEVAPPVPVPVPVSVSVSVSAPVSAPVSVSAPLPVVPPAPVPVVPPAPVPVVPPAPVPAMEPRRALPPLSMEIGGETLRYSPELAIQKEILPFRSSPSAPGETAAAKPSPAPEGAPSPITPVAPPTPVIRGLSPDMLGRSIGDETVRVSSSAPAGPVMPFVKQGPGKDAGAATTDSASSSPPEAPKPAVPLVRSITPGAGGLAPEAAKDAKPSGSTSASAAASAGTPPNEDTKPLPAVSDPAGDGTKTTSRPVTPFRASEESKTLPRPMGQLGGTALTSKKAGSPAPKAAPGASTSTRARAKAAPEDPGAAEVAGSVERHAAIAAELSVRKGERAKVLKENGLSEASWPGIDEKWSETLSQAMDRGDRALINTHDAAYVATQERLGRKIGVEEYARILVGIERGEVGAVLASLELALSDLVRIQRVWAKRLADNPPLGGEVEKAVDAVRGSQG